MQIWEAWPARPTALLLFAALLLVPLTPAAAQTCPHDCSGNGNCTIELACNCVSGWSGGDCSLRTSVGSVCAVVARHPSSSACDLLSFPLYCVQGHAPLAQRGWARAPLLPFTSRSCHVAARGGATPPLASAPARLDSLGRRAKEVRAVGIVVAATPAWL